MKNTLAENLLRFGVKNLSEADTHRLTEQAYTVVPLVINVPYKLDPATKELNLFEPGSYVYVTAKKQTGTQYTNLDDFKNFGGIDFVFNGDFIKFATSQKDAAGNIVGKFLLTKENKGAIAYLTKNIGKTLSPGDKTLMITLNPIKGGQVQPYYTAGTVFNKYDINKAAPTTPR